MAVTRVNLDREVGRAIHFPRFEDTPLYTRVPECKEAYVDRLEDVANKSAAWVRKSQLTYGSPNNIRRLFITSEGVKTHLYQPITYRGSRGGNTSLMREKKFKGFNITEAFDSLSQGRRDYIITKSGLGALSHPWVASNIEEVYFDWTVLLSEDVMNMGLGNLLIDINSQQTNRIEKSELPYELFKHFCCRGEEVSNKFPRLKVVGYIQQLSRVYPLVSYKKGKDNIEDMKRLWCFEPAVRAAGADPNCRILIYNVPNVPRLNTKRRIRDGIYLYDREVLKPYFDNMVNSINNYASDRGKEKQPEEVSTIKSEIEMTLDEMFERDGAEFTARAVKIMFTDRNYARLAYSEMSTAGKERYKGMFA